MANKEALTGEENTRRGGLAAANCAACAVITALCFIFPLFLLPCCFLFSAPFFAANFLIGISVFALAIYSTLKLKISAFEKTMWIVWLLILPIIIYPILNRKFSRAFCGGSRIKFFADFLIFAALFAVCFWICREILKAP